MGIVEWISVATSGLLFVLSLAAGVWSGKPKTLPPDPPRVERQDDRTSTLGIWRGVGADAGREVQGP